MKHGATLIVLASLVGLSTGANAADFSYSYLEATADLSKTRNTAPAPLADDADGRLFGLAGSWEVFDTFYLKGAWSRETKEFGNEVARTPVDLDSRQTIFMLGAGYHFELGERTSLYAEALMIVDFEVEHSIPLVTPSAFGPPTVTTTRSVIKGNGVGGVLGIRSWVSENVEFEVQISRIHTSGDVPRTGGEISDSETMLRIAAHVHAGAGYPSAGMCPTASIPTTTSTTSGSSASLYATISESRLRARSTEDDVGWRIITRLVVAGCAAFSRRHGLNERLLNRCLQESGRFLLPILGRFPAIREAVGSTSAAAGRTLQGTETRNCPGLVQLDALQLFHHKVAFQRSIIRDEFDTRNHRRRRSGRFTSRTRHTAS